MTNGSLTLSPTMFAMSFGLSDIYSQTPRLCCSLETRYYFDASMFEYMNFQAAIDEFVKFRLIRAYC